MTFLFGIWLFSATVQIFYLLYFFIKATNHLSINDRNEDLHNCKDPISIIICARNEAENLKTNLPFHFDQDYHNYEIIVVDDGSTDDTAGVVQGYMLENKHLHYYKIEDTFPGKKEALTYGIEKANNDILLLTDADCRPSSAQWVTLMADKFNATKHIVLGLGPLNRKAGFLNSLQRFENETVALLYIGMALRGKTYMGVGRNLAYKKEVFQASSGFKDHIHIPSGDDDLFIGDVADADNVSVSLHPDARCYSDGPSSWSSWIKQKSRHQSTGKLYKPEIKWLLNLYYLSLPLFFISSLILFFLNCNIILLLGVYIFRLCLLNYSLKNLNKGHESKSNIFSFIINDWALLVFYFLSTILLIFRKSDEW